MDHDHLPALTLLMFAAPVAVLALAVGRFRVTVLPLEAQAVALGLFIAGVIHLGLIPGHLEEPVFAASFAVAGIAMLGLAVAALTTSWWRVPAAVCVTSVLAAYVLTRLAGLEGIDALGVATFVIELSVLALVARTPSLAMT